MSLLTLALIVAATNTAPNNNGTTTKTNASKTTLKASKNTKGNAGNAPQDPNAPAPQDGAVATDPKKAEKGTIRADFADSIDANAVHGSDGPDTAAHEIGFFFAGMNVFGH